MPGRKIHDRDDASQCLNLIQASGLTLSAWCHAHQVDGRSLGAWANNIARRGQEKPRPAPAPLQLVELTTRAPIPVQRYTIRCGAFSVEVDESVDTSVLRRILEALPLC